MSASLFASVIGVGVFVGVEVGSREDVEVGTDFFDMMQGSDRRRGVTAGGLAEIGFEKLKVINKRSSHCFKDF